MNIKSADQRKSLTATLLATLCLASVALAQTTVFTYQGRLTDTGGPASGTYDLQFKLFDTGTVGSGAQQGSTVMVSNVTVTAGVFTVQLDFGAGVFPGANRFLEIAVKATNVVTFTVLGPRQAVTATPYAIKSINAMAADSLSGACINCVTGNQIQSLPTGSTAYIQNTTTPQISSNFNISGNGTVGGVLTAGIVNATTQYSMGGSRILRAEGAKLFVGSSSGGGTTGIANTFVGAFTGSSNTTGVGNVFFGSLAGFSNRTGSENTIIGHNADTGPDNLLNATAIGASARVDQSNSLVLGSIAGVNSATASVLVGIGTTTPLAALHVNGGALVTPGGGREVSIGTPNGEAGFGIRGTSNRADVRFDGTTLKLVAGVNTGPPASTSGIAITTAGNVGIGQTGPLAKLDVAGTLKVDQLAGGGDEPLCRNSVFRTVATCGSSLRYKERIAPYNAGLELVNLLRPISFAWKTGGRRDLGLGAEEVAKVEPLLVTRNDKGEIEGVKYAQLNVILINAVKEQQAQIETLQMANAALDARLRALERVARKKTGAARRRP
jgi:hypothetical protein